jgi:predicted TIM-barrel fold metal-dependent hydrolase
VTRAIDGLVNVDMGDQKQPEWMTRVKDDYFKAGDSFFTSPELNELLEDMDAHGVEKAILLTRLPRGRGQRGNGDSKGPDRAQRFATERPDRFALGVGGVDLLRPMPTLRKLESFVADHPVAHVTVGPSFWGDGLYPPSDAVYYPLYTKCAELDLPLCLNTGIPGPPIPGEAQHPMHLDRVCVRFPELRLCMIHGADPWWDVAIRLMLKYRNLRLMTSAWSPKRLPESLLHYMRTRGQDRIMFASDYPVLSFERTLGEAARLDLDDEVRDAWLYGNAEAFFFGEHAQQRLGAAGSKAVHSE